MMKNRLKDRHTKIRWKQLDSMKMTLVKDKEKDNTSYLALMAMNHEEFRGNSKYDVLEDDTWIGDTGTSTHTTNSSL